jgi:peptidoglycan DL-endopeptidase CwlO
MSDRPRGRWIALVALVGALVLAFAVPAAAAPGAPGGPGDEGGSQTLGQALESANRAYLDAQAALDASKKRQADLTKQAEQVEAELVLKTAEAGGIAATAYRLGPLSTASAMLDSASPDRFLDRASALKGMATRNDHKLRELGRLRKELKEARAKIDAEVAFQEQQVATMGKKKQETERALAAAGGKATGGFVSVSSPLAQPAPRRADGSFAPESCVIDDPTTSGCITARMLHAYNEARSAGFTRYTACFRTGDQYEHPKGRACDFSASATGFGGVASGGDRVYGNNLAAYFVRNANALAVLYVIWFLQIWTPAAGWHSYGGGRGDPASNHQNHVHLSVY